MELWFFKEDTAGIKKVKGRVGMAWGGGGWVVCVTGTTSPSHAAIIITSTKSQKLMQRNLIFPFANYLEIYNVYFTSVMTTYLLIRKV